jgi:ABC-2 type transport system ATP-binding protein
MGVNLRIENVSKRFGAVNALDHISLSIDAGTCLGLLGKNGAGKTTLLRLLNLIHEPDSGSIFWNGETINRGHLQQVGYVPEERGLYPQMKVLDQLLFLGQLRGMTKAEAKNAAMELLQRYNLDQHLTTPLRKLSKGNQQWIQYISSLLHAPALLILDEPFSGLDPSNAAKLITDLQQKTKEGTTILFSSHRLDHVRLLSSHIAFIQQGSLSAHGTLNEWTDKLDSLFERTEHE